MFCTKSGSSRAPSSRDWPKQEACLSYHLEYVKYANTLNPKVLLRDSHVSSDGGEILWYGEPYFQLETINGTFCHKDCKRFASFGTFVDGMCSACNSIPKIDSFWLKLQRRSDSRGDSDETDTSKTNFTYLPRDQLLLNSEKPKISNLNAAGLKSFCWVAL